MYSSLQCCFLAIFTHYSQSSLTIQSSLTPRTLHIWEVGRRDAQKVHPGSLDYRGEVVETVPPCGGDGVVRETRIDVSGHQRTHTDVSVKIKS